MTSASTRVVALPVQPPPGYAGLSAAVAKNLRIVAKRIKARQTASVIETGRDLIDVKGKLDHGQFEKWLRAEFGMSVRTAQKYMSAAELMEGKSELDSLLPPTTLYIASAKSTPDEARQAIIDLAETGQTVPPASAKALLAEAKRKERDKAKRAERARRRQPGYKERAEARRLKRLQQEEQQRQRKQAEREAMGAEIATILHRRLTKTEFRRVAELLPLSGYYAGHITAAIEKLLTGVAGDG